MNGAHICPIKNEKLLLSTDGSEFSEGAIREAIGFAKRCSSSLYAMTVFRTNPEYETIAPGSYEKEELKTKEHLDSVKERALKEGVKCETFPCYDDVPHKCIVDEAAKRQVDMIVIGRRGSKGLAKILMGEVAAKVIGHAPCKVLVVPRAARIECRSLLVATDSSAHSMEAVSEALEIAKRCGSKVIALLAIRNKNESEEAQAHVNAIIELGKKEGVAVEGLTPRGRLYDVIVETAGGRGVDLIIVGTYEKTGLKKMLMGNSAEKVIENAGCAVLVVKTQ